MFDIFKRLRIPSEQLSTLRLSQKKSRRFKRFLINNGWISPIYKGTFLSSDNRFHIFTVHTIPRCDFIILSEKDREVYVIREKTRIFMHFVSRLSYTKPVYNVSLSFSGNRFHIFTVHTIFRCDFIILSEKDRKVYFFT